MLGNVLGLLIGFMLGVLVRNSSGAIVGYFVYSLVLPPLTGLLAATQGWFRDLQPWVDFSFAQGALFNGVDDRRPVGAPRGGRHDLAAGPAHRRARPGDALRGQVALSPREAIGLRPVVQVGDRCACGGLPCSQAVIGAAGSGRLRW